MKPLYTEVFTLKISSTQKRTLEKLKSRNIKVSDFVRKAKDKGRWFDSSLTFKVLLSPKSFACVWGLCRSNGIYKVSNSTPLFFNKKTAKLVAVD